MLIVITTHDQSFVRPSFELTGDGGRCPGRTTSLFLEAELYRASVSLNTSRKRAGEKVPADETAKACLDE